MPKLAERPNACPRCSGRIADEPGAVRCVICGRIWYLSGMGVEQREFEQRSGMSSPLGILRIRRTVGTRHIYTEWDTAFT